MPFLFALLLIGLSSPLFADELQEFSLKVGGLDRRYLVHLPKGYRKEKPVPVVLNIHGGGGNAQATALTTGMSAHSDRHGYIVVFPEGTGKSFRGHLHATWNAGKCCADSVKKHIDDVAYFSEVIKDLKKRFAVDDKRIYATGLSNGGMMSYQLACALSETIAAIAPVGAEIVADTCPLKRHVPTLHVHGTEDHCLPYQGGKGGDCFNNFLHKLFPLMPLRKETSNLTFPSVPELVKDWAKKNGIPPEAKETEFYRNKGAFCSSRKGTERNQEVGLCVVGGGGHSWPGGEQGKFCSDPSSRTCRLWVETVGTISRDLDANEVMWNFFSRHSL